MRISVCRSHGGLFAAVVALGSASLFAHHADASVLLYEQDFENPSGFVNGPIDVSQQNVNSLYGNQPAGFAFAQQWTVETLLITGTQAFGTGYSDPSGAGGDYALGMLSSVQNDLLGLSFDVGAFGFLNFGLDISSIDLSGLGGPFVSQGAIPKFKFSLYDNPTGATGLNGNGTLLDSAEATGTASAQSVFDWTAVVVGLNAAGSTNGNVTLQIDLLEGGYAAMDNFRIVASDREGDIGLIPEPTAVAVWSLLVACGVGCRRGRKVA